ncbi:hypothetical protein CYMTET_7997 [Cymbomonas tetramitiformis]|uniref:Uncharacterized protein n=1 Tax=Cymbomonas tetramitiformis TaxID=36881 RepID=A0AAE0GUH5_9CHLO|nr:hypothetical protein CYMTET_7997 [Cymbomonas tetramitiformis]
MELTKYNLFAKADRFRRFRMKSKFASFKSTLKHMVRSGKYVLCTDFITEGRGLSEERCESLWKMVIMPALTVDTDITNVPFPSSTSYFDRSRYFDNKIVNSDTQIRQMPYEESDVSYTAEEQTRRVYEARQNVPKDTKTVAIFMTRRQR